MSESRIAQKRVVVAKHEFLENMHRGCTSTRGVEGGSFPLGSCVDTCVVNSDFRGRRREHEGL